MLNIMILRKGMCVFKHEFPKYETIELGNIFITTCTYKYF